MKQITMPLKILFLYLFLVCISLSSHAETVAYGSEPTPVVDNLELIQNVNNAVKKNPRTAKLQIKLTVDRGVVFISGTIASYLDAVYLVQLISLVEGVRDVGTNELTVLNGPANLSDLLITARVQGAIVREKIFGKVDIDHLPIDVNTNLGIVYLSGVVDNQGQMLSTIRLIQSMRSIPRVISKLVIRQVSVVR